MILRDDGKVLLCRRLKAPEAGFWNIVGGKVDPMEPSSEAARREVLINTPYFLPDRALRESRERGDERGGQVAAQVTTRFVVRWSA